MSNVTICLHCGGDVRLDPRTGIPTCLNCRREYKDTLEDTSYELQEIVKARQQREFLKAEELCEELKKMQPESSEVYWQTLLAELGVVYVKEGNVSKPTFFSFSYDDREKIKDSQNYKNAIQFARSEDDRRFYEEKATELDELLKEFFDLVAKENSYDIFISFKQTEEVTDSSGEKRSMETEDCAKAREIYNYFKDKYRVFFSPVSIGKDTGIQGEKYEPKILKALQTSQAMILVGTKKEFLAAQWVENEWKRFRYFIEKGKKDKRSLILAYRRNIPSLPLGLKDIQLPNVDMFNATYLKELEKQLEAFVSTSKGLKSKLKGRNIKQDFIDEDTEFNFGHNVARVKINGSGNNQTITISATEERVLKSAEDMLEHKKFKDALRTFDGVIAKSPKCSRAYWGRFLSNIKCPSKDGKGFKDCLLSVKPEWYADIDTAIDNSSDMDFSWKIVDALIVGLDNQLPSWTKQKELYDVILKYIDESRAECVLKKLKARFDYFLSQGKVKVCEEIFANARKIFFDEHREDNITYMADVAETYLKAQKYDNARLLYEELVLARKTSDMYLKLLQCRVKTQDIQSTKFNLNVNSEDDSSDKKPAELDLDEIIERIVICEKDHPFFTNSRSIKALYNCVYYQIFYNSKNAGPFVETIFSCLQPNSIKNAKKFLISVAEKFLEAKKFSQAKIYFNEILVHDQQDAEAHWGLLKCALKASNDQELMLKRKKFTRHEEFENARASATNEQFDYFTAVYNGEANVKNGSSSSKKSSGKSGSSKSKSNNSTYKKPQGFISKWICTLLYLLTPLTMLAGSILMVGSPEKIFAFIHWGWLLAIYIVVLVITFCAILGFSQDAYKNPESRLIKFRCSVAMAIVVITAIMALFGMLNANKQTIGISNARELNLIRNLPGAKKAVFVLEDDIDFEGEKFKKFAKTKDFEGVFDGNGHTIKNMVVEKDKKLKDSSKEFNFGLFKNIINNGVVKNVTFENCNVNMTFKGTYYQNIIRAGFITGVNDKGLISDVKFVNSVFSVTYDNCQPRGTIGFVVGNNLEDGTIKNCSVTNNSPLADDIPYNYFVKYDVSWWDDDLNISSASNLYGYTYDTNDIISSYFNGTAGIVDAE